jgi:hypothetical protein
MLLKTEAFLANEEAQEHGQQRRLDDDEGAEAKKAKCEDADMADAQPPTTEGHASSSSSQPMQDNTVLGKRQSEMSLEEFEHSVNQII